MYEHYNMIFLTIIDSNSRGVDIWPNKRLLEAQLAEHAITYFISVSEALIAASKYTSITPFTYVCQSIFFVGQELEGNFLGLKNKKSLRMWEWGRK